MSAEKICGCDSSRWPKCAHPWYLSKFRYAGKAHSPNLTRYAIEVLGRTALDTKTEADALADDVRAAIRNGTYVSAKTKKNTVVEQQKSDAVVRVRMSAAIGEFNEDVIDGDLEKRDQQKKRDKAMLAQIAAFKPSRARGAIGDLAVADVTADDLVAFRRCDAVRELANSSWAKFRTIVVMFFNWAKSKNTAERLYTHKTPFDAIAPHQKKALARGKFAQRRRRIYPAEEALLLRAAAKGFHGDAAERLEAIIVAMIETAMRPGELLALQWRDVNLVGRTITVRAEEEDASKTGARLVAMSETLYQMLDAMRDATGARPSRRAYVFGHGDGSKVESVQKAWETCVLVANGHKPAWTKKGALTPSSRAKYNAAEIVLYDFRHEGACRWLESGVWNLGEIQAMLGHTTIAQTATYLHVDVSSPQAAMRRLDEKRKRDAKTAAVAAAAAAPNPGSGVQKRSENAESGDRSVNGPRLVKSDNRHVGV